MNKILKVKIHSVTSLKAAFGKDVSRDFLDPDNQQWAFWSYKFDPTHDHWLPESIMGKTIEVIALSKWQMKIKRNLNVLGQKKDDQLIITDWMVRDILDDGSLAELGVILDP